MFMMLGEKNEWKNKKKLLGLAEFGKSHTHTQQAKKRQRPCEWCCAFIYETRIQIWSNKKNSGTEIIIIIIITITIKRVRTIYYTAYILLAQIYNRIKWKEMKKN